MKYRLLNYLVCPECGSDLKISVFRESRHNDQCTVNVPRCKQVCSFKDHSGETSGGGPDCAACFSHEIEAGIISCQCNNVYPVSHGIPRMLPDAFGNAGEFVDTYRDSIASKGLSGAVDEALLKKSAHVQHKTKVSFGYQWLRYDVNDQAEDRSILLSDAQLSEECLRGSLVLDAGCGMGRYTSVAAGMGAEIIGLDLSPSILKAYERTGRNPRAHIMQGDILHLPLRQRQFDIIYSLGVLHHTPDPKQAFFNLTGCLKPGGIISVWVYGTAGKFSDFASNPLRKERRKYVAGTNAKRLHWLTVFLRETLYDGIRVLTTRMNVPLLYLLCYPLAALGKVPLVRYLTASVHPNWRVRLQENFDWFSPQYQSHHTKEEVRGWFEKAHLEVVSQLEHGFIPKVGFKGRLTRKP